MRNHAEEAIEAEHVDEVPEEPIGLTTDRQAQAVAKLDAMIGGAVQRALDERARAEAAEKAKDESTPEARAEYWQSIAVNTRRGYEADWRRFEAWCTGRQLPVGLAGVEVEDLEPAEIEAAFVRAKPEMICAYVQDMFDRELKLTSITRAAAAIGRIHERYGEAKPTRAMKVRDKLAHLRRAAVDDRRNRVKKANATTRDHYTAIMSTCGDRATRRQLRNAALLSTWFNVGARRDEIRNLRREDVRIVWSKKLQDHVLIIHIFKSKTDQEGVGVDIPIQRRAARELCALRAVQAWLQATSDELGDGDPLFPRMRRDAMCPQSMSLRSLDLLVKKAAVGAGFEEHEFSTHSFRAGCVTFLYALSKRLRQCGAMPQVHHGRLWCRRIGETKAVSGAQAAAEDFRDPTWCPSYAANVGQILMHRRCKTFPGCIENGRLPEIAPGKVLLLAT